MAGPFCNTVHRLAAIDASLSLVPSRYDAADQAGLPHRFHLVQAVLGTALPFRPPRTVLKAEVNPAPKSL